MRNHQERRSPLRSSEIPYGDFLRGSGRPPQRGRAKRESWRGPQPRNSNSKAARRPRRRTDERPQRARTPPNWGACARSAARYVPLLSLARAMETLAKARRDAPEAPPPSEGSANKSGDRATRGVAFDHRKRAWHERPSRYNGSYCMIHCTIQTEAPHAARHRSHSMGIHGRKQRIR